MAQRTKRPATVTAIGWGYIALSLLMIPCGVGFFAVSRWLRQKWVSEALALHMSVAEATRQMSFQMRYYWLIALAQTLVAVVILVLGIQFMRLRAWARTALEAVTWLVLSCAIAGSVAAALMPWLEPHPSVVEEGLGRKVPLAAFGMASQAPFVVLAVLTIKGLRGRRVREAVRPGV